MAPNEYGDRVAAVEPQTYRRLYQESGDALGAGWYQQDGAQAVWLAGEDDPDFCCVSGLANSPDPVITLQDLESHAREHGATMLGVSGDPRTLAAISVDQLLALGYTPDYQEYVWVRPLSIDIPDHDLKPHVRLERATASDRETFARVLNQGFEIDADRPRGTILANAIGLPGFFHYLVYVNDEPATASILSIVGEAAHLYVAATVPALRGHGGQTAVIRQRMLDAREHGCTFATSTTVADNASPRNMGRHEFSLVYERTLYRKDL